MKVKARPARRNLSRALSVATLALGALPALPLAQAPIATALAAEPANPCAPRKAANPCAPKPGAANPCAPKQGAANPCAPRGADKTKQPGCGDTSKNPCAPKPKC